MIVEHIYDTEIEPLTLEDTGEVAFKMLGDQHLRHLPILDAEGQVYGLVSEDEIITQGLAQKLGKYKMGKAFPFLHPEDHFFNAIKMLSETKVSVLPVVDKDKKYLGSITDRSIVEFLSASGSFSELGSILLLEMQAHEYSLAELSRIIEMEKARILNVFLYLNPDSDILQLSLKLNIVDASHIVATLVRFGYTVKDAFQKDEKYYDGLKDRLDSFMAYLNI